MKSYVSKIVGWMHNLTGGMAGISDAIVMVDEEWPKVADELVTLSSSKLKYASYTTVSVSHLNFKEIFTTKPGIYVCGSFVKKVLPYITEIPKGESIKCIPVYGFDLLGEMSDDEMREIFRPIDAFEINDGLGFIASCILTQRDTGDGLLMVATLPKEDAVNGLYLKVNEKVLKINIFQIEGEVGEWYIHALESGEDDISWIIGDRFFSGGVMLRN